jgi:ribonucleotide reductase class II
MFPESAPSANPVFYRTYSRRTDSGKESWADVVERCVAGLAKVGKFTAEEEALVRAQMERLHSLPSGRWLWVGGTPWVEEQKNYSGAYNCTSTDTCDLKAFPLQMELLMMGSGTGAILEPRCIDQLPVVCNRFDLTVLENIGEASISDPNSRIDITEGESATIYVGDSREGWTDAFLILLELATDANKSVTSVTVDLSNVRPPGTAIKGFGGVANPVKLAHFYRRAGEILQKAHGRQLTSVECCLLLDESSLAVVAGNVRRSAGMRQFSSWDKEAAAAKDNLWQQGEDGKWRIDPERDALRMANHTRVFHQKPTFEDVKESVTKQFYSGEGAIQYAPEAIARSNADLLFIRELQERFIQIYETLGREAAGLYLRRCEPLLSDQEVEHRLSRYGLNPCGEILGADFHCNLSEVHLNTLDPRDKEGQAAAFKAAALSACALLHHKFKEERYQYSRSVDPIIGVSFTGLFDFFVKRFGAEWLEWWEAGRPRNEYYQDVEATYLKTWRRIVEDTVKEYCSKHGLKVPNRFTTVQPAGTKSLLTGASPGWHPPKAARFIRRITFAKNDPVALACEAYGYKIIPSQSDRDETGALLDDPRDPRCNEWLVEIPTETIWANIEGCDGIDVNKFSVAAQFDFYMQVQQHYTTHNTSATLEFRENEIETLSQLIYDSIGQGYISAALLARFDANETFPRLPFEPIDKDTFQTLTDEVVSRRITSEFGLAMSAYAGGHDAAGPAACDSDKCLFEEKAPQT